MVMKVKPTAGKTYKKNFKRKPNRYIYKMSKLIPEKGPKFEKKWHDVSGTLSAVNSTNILSILMNGISEGTTPNSRIGRQIDMKSYQIRLSIYPQVVSGVPQLRNQWIRYLVVYDKKPNSSSIPSLYGSISTTSVLETGNGNPIESIKNLYTSDRYVILCDKRRLMEYNDNTTQYNVNEFHFEKYGKLKAVAEYNNTGGAIGNMVNGALYLYVVVSDDISGDVSPKAPTVEYTTRIRYLDA